MFRLDDASSIVDESLRPGRRRTAAAPDAALVAAALEGFGILYIREDAVAAPIADGRLTRLLERWCEPFAGYHLYFPNRQGTAAFELFKEALRTSSAARPRGHAG